MVDNSNSGFWTSIPGILTGVAAIVTAVTAIVGLRAANQGGASASPPSASVHALTGPDLPSPSPKTKGVKWPPYPGEAVVGVTGSIADGWQTILIRCGAISDISDNRDGVYGEATGEKVEQIEAHWGWADADTTADRLTYNRIVDSGCN